MAKQRGRTKIALDGGVCEPINTPFGSLSALRDNLPAGDCASSGGDAGEDQAPGAGQLFAPKVVISRERNGRGGKTVTVVRGVLASGAALDEFVRELRKALGTSAAIDGEAIVVGGAPGERLAAWLRAQGAPNVVVGNRSVTTGRRGACESCARALPAC